MTAHQNPAEPGPGEPLYGPESASTPVGGTPGGPNPLNGPQTGAEGFHREREAAGGGEEQAAPVDWQATVRARERELKQVGEARHQAEAAIARIRALAEEHPVAIPTNLIDAALDQPTPGPAATQTTEAGCDHDSQVIDHEGAQYWACMKCGTNLGRVEPAPDIGYAQAVDRVQSSGPQPAAHDAGPTVAEAAADDARWWGGEKRGE